MQHYRKTSHTVYDIKYHLVWITKYRKRVLTGVLAARVRSLIREICKANEVEIIKGHISSDHVHLFVSVPPHISVSKLMQYIKGKSSRKVMSEFKAISKMYWGRHFWARGYFVVSSGTITDEMIMEYIEKQDIEDKDGDFKISGE
ncbi:MAG: IS200/IS605 family transposase [Flavobacteriales bacterium]|nr:IS200/IS605 family transposase [Flavobacteriales bacterium]PIV93450.1 MAG: IS200/IS605 family transposase [Flavobacteriaceae bacterium CG17_big_fil_post_rev_8_21_14_2_50_33_15]PIY09469.1 MAG: IS200/IS605 family transposase [Flavobacteriaceae bacterium CG_4_10_14_3_um_filter_33_47]NCP50706.1 IS200/IS605 family transposase [Flavobacteriales bacterium]NCQ14395.1 IS200/IS605 family transposase [Flavobacteriales bacterium]